MSSAGSGRLKLLLIVAAFAAPILLALALRISGWQAVGTRQHGTLLAPPQDFNAVVAQARDGKPLRWNNVEGIWRVLLVAPAECANPCVEMIDTLQRVWMGLGRRAARVEVLYVGAPPADVERALARFPQARVVGVAGEPLPMPAATAPALPVYVVDPHGYVVLRYDAGFDPRGLTKDLERVLR